ncbi:MAG: HD-GYP domain-containing protein, partial [bacterium]
MSGKQENVIYNNQSDNRPLAFYLFIGAVCTVMLMETVVWVLTNYGAEWLILSIRSDIFNQIPPTADLTPAELMSKEKVTDYVLLSSRLTVLLFMSTITVILICFLLILRYWVFSPIELILEKNNLEEEKRPELVSEKNIPANEIGAIIRSRNELLSTMDQIFSEEAIETLVQAVEEKDPYTQGHSRRVGEFGALLGREYGLKQETCAKLRYSGTLHDLGKIGVSDQILTKPDELTDEEYEQIKSHPERGANIIQFGIFDDDILNGILHHHEAYDGSGYP